MDKHEFKNFAMRASEVVIVTKGLRNDFAVVSKDYYMEVRLYQESLEQCMRNLPDHRARCNNLHIMMREGACQAPVQLEKSPIFDVEVNVEEMLEYWLLSDGCYERGIIIADEPVRKAFDSLIDKSIAEVVKEKNEDKYQLLKTKAGNTIHLYCVPDVTLFRESNSCVIDINDR